MATVDDIRKPVHGDLVETELGTAVERLEITKLETLLTLADRLGLPPRSPRRSRRRERRRRMRRAVSSR
ncbi:hypothetical protein ACFQGT_06675 [Natrialbaceae archaeon GCM10025810]|uniref:hypothetical protein n=1 Tax=Halovalidus salilacus TaxID=3075124 RepID=UPI003607CFF7